MGSVVISFFTSHLSAQIYSRRAIRIGALFVSCLRSIPVFQFS